VGGQNQVVVREVPRARCALDAGVIKYAQLRHKTRGLLLPVENQRAWDDRQRWTGAPGTAVLQQCQHLHRLAQAHVIGETAAETEIAQELEPAQRLLLVRTQFPLETSRRSARGDAG